jgi:protein-S-isoprenylcysteine O-methyltransferase Ste14
VSSFAQSATSNPVVSDPARSDSWLAIAGRRTHGFLLRRRVKISIALFSSMVIRDMVSGAKPRDIADLTNASTLIGLGLVLAGLLLRSWGAGVLCKETLLCRTGPYSLIRHPLYVGSFMMMFGFCKLIGDAGNMLVIAGPVVWLYLLKIREEELGLLERYAGEWQEYAAATPRFFPWRVTSAIFRDWNFSQWLGSLEYRALTATLAAFVALKVWRIL